MRPRDPQSLFRLFLLWLAGNDLRITILALPPVLPLIHRDLALNETAVAALTALPVLLLAIAAIPGSLLIARIGARRALIAGLLLVAVASALRGLGPSVPMLFLMTFLMGAGVSVMQPALPSLVSRWFPSAPAMATAVYANGLLIGETLAAGFTLALVVPLAGGGWASTLALWAVPVALTAALIAGFTPEGQRTARHGLLWWPDWRDSLVWRIGLMQSGCGTIYFGANAFIPDYLHAIGQGGLTGLCLGVLNAGQLPASFLILLFARRLAGRKEPVVAVGLLAFLGLAGLLSQVPALMILGAGLDGFSAGFILILTLALPPLLAPAGDVHRLSAGAYTLGYAGSFLLPLLGGAAADASGVVATVFLPVAVGGVLVLLIAATMPTRPPAVAAAAPR